MKKIISLIAILLLSFTAIGQVQFLPSLITASIGEPAVPTQDEFLITTTSTSATWSPQLITNTGSALSWEVSGGVTIAEQVVDDPTFDLSTNTGVAVITVRSPTGFVGWTHLSLINLDIVEVVVPDLLPDMYDFEVKSNPALSVMNLGNMPAVWRHTIRSNNLSTIDLTNNPALELLFIYSNQLTYIDIMSNPLLSEVHVQSNKLTDAALDEIVTVLDANGVSNGILNLSTNTGVLTPASYTAFQSLKAKGWTITPTDHPYVPPVTPPQETLVAELSGFYVDSNNPTHVNFTASADVTGMAETGFVISGKTINGPPYVDPDGLGGYFTVTAPFTFWDNNTIRLGENNSLTDVNAKVHNFTLDYIDNLIPEPEAATPKYVSNAGSGTACTEGAPCSMTYALANALPGETWWIKAGNYPVSTTMQITRDGDALNPIKFIGYKDAIGDISSNYWSYEYGALNTTMMPTFTGASTTDTQLFNINNAHYVIFRNIQMTNARRGVRANQSSTWANNSSHIIFDRINGYIFGDANNNDGSFIALNNSFGNDNAGHIGHLNCRIINSIGVNAAMSIFEIRGDGFCLFENNKGYNDRTSAVEANSRVDYFIPFSGNNNIARNNHMENKLNLTSSSMHGIGVRGGERDFYGVNGTNNYNLIELNNVVAVKEALFARNFGSSYNVFKDNTVNSTGLMLNSQAAGGLFVWGGADYNIFERNYILDVTVGIGWKNNDESNTVHYVIGHDNIFRNNIFKNIRISNWIYSDISATELGTNYIYNNTFYDVDEFFDNDSYTTVIENGTDKLIFTNNIFHTVPKVSYGNPNQTFEDNWTDVIFTNNNFFNSGTWANTYIDDVNGNKGIDPTFFNTTDFLPQNEALVADKITGINSDYNGAERAAITTKGAVLLASEVPVQPLIVAQLSGFAIENASPTQVNFTASADVTGLTTADFYISGYGLPDSVVIDGDGLGGYFTVTTPFTYWDNNTIRLDANNGIVKAFTMEYIANNINEPSTTTVRYASASGSGTHDGLSEANAWSYVESFSSLNTTTGMLIHWKAGTLNSSDLNIGRSGTATAPIIYKGYKTTPGDLDGVTYYSYGDGALSGLDAPLIVGTSSDAYGGIYNSSVRNYIIFKNIQLDSHSRAVRMWGNENGRVFDNMVIKDCGTGINSSNPGNQRIRVTNSIAVNQSESAYNLTGSYNAIINSKSYSDYGPTMTPAQDYYIIMENPSNYNIIKGCYIERSNNTAHSGHGYALKGAANTLVDNCIAKGINAPFQFRHSYTSNSVVKNSSADGNGQTDTGGIVFRDGAQNNIVENVIITNSGGSIYYTETTEDLNPNIYSAYNNTVRNSIFDGNEDAIGNSYGTSATRIPATNNKIYNCTFKGITSRFFYLNADIVTCELTNIIVEDCTAAYEVGAYANGFTWLNSIFSGNSFATPTGGTTQDALLNLSYQPQAAFADVSAPKILGVDFDKNGNERATTTTIGAILHADEAQISPPDLIADYYVSTSGTGTGTGSYLDPLNFTQLQALVPVAGDTIALKGGDEFYGNLTLTNLTGTALAPIVYTSYNGQAVIKGSEAITGWTDTGGNIWSKAIATPVYQVFDTNGDAIPNAKSADLVINTAPTTSTFTCASLDGRTDLVGATVFFRRYTWYQSYSTITAFDDATDLVTIDVGNLPTYGFDAGTTINIVNAVNDLTAGTWRYASGTLYMGSVGAPTGISQSSNVTSGITITGSDYITIDNLGISDFNSDGIALINTNYITVKNNLLKNNYEHGVAANITLGPYNSASGTQIDILDNEISGSMYEGLRNYAVGSTMSGNYIHNIGTINLYTYLRSASSRALVSSDDNHTITNNILSNLGYNGISFTGQNATIEYNQITDFCNFLYDGGAIYTYTGASGGVQNTPHKGAFSIVQYNTITGDETHKGKTIAGIYLDDASVDIEVKNNNISTTARGVFLHNTARTDVQYNTIYNTQYGIRISEDSNWGDGQTIDNNISNNKVFIESNYIDPVLGQRDAAFFMSSAYDNLNLYTGGNNKYFNNGDQQPINVLNQSVYFQSVNQFARPHTVSEMQTLTGTETGSTQNSTWNNQPFAYSNAQAPVVSADFSAGTSGWFGGYGTLSDGGGYAHFIPTPATTNGYFTTLGSGWFSVTEGDYYLVEFDIQSAGADHIIRVALNQAVSPYQGMEIRPVNVTSDWVSHKYLYYADYTVTTEARIEFMERTTDIGFNLDNISVRKVDKDVYTLTNSFFASNSTSVAADIALPAGTWVTLDGNNYSGTINLQPYSSEILTLLVPTYTVSNTDGTADYASLTTLLATETLVPGDIVALKGGDEFQESVSISASGAIMAPITFTSYGTGKAVLKGDEPVTNWVDQGGNIWTSDVTGKTVYQVLRNDVALTNGRIPAIQGDLALEGNYYSITSGSGVSYVSDDLQGLGVNHIVGAKIHALTKPWIMETRTIQTYDTATGAFTIDLAFSYDLVAGYLFVVNNHVNLVTTQDAWSYSGNTLSMYSVGVPSGISISTNAGIGLDISSDYITIDNLKFRGFDAHAIHGGGAESLIIKNSSFYHNYDFGIRLDGTTASTNLVDNCSFLGGDCGIRTILNNTTIKNSSFTEQGAHKNLSYKAFGQMKGVMTQQQKVNAQIHDNTFTNIGYNAIACLTEGSSILRNYVENSNLTAYDGAGIYTWGGDGVLTNTVIQDNTVVQNADYSNSPFTVSALYLDDNTSGVTVSDNTLIGGKWTVYLHNAHDNILTGNKISKGQEHSVSVVNDAIHAAEPTNNTFTGNSVIAHSLISRPVRLINYITSTWDFLLADNNHYANPYSVNSFEVKSTTVNGGNTNYAKMMSLADWQTFSSRDGSSTEDTLDWTEFVIDGTVGSNLVTNGEPVTTADWDAWNGTKTIMNDGSDFIRLTSDNGSNQGIFKSPKYVTTAGKSYLIQYEAKTPSDVDPKSLFFKYDDPFAQITSGIVADITSAWRTYKLKYDAAASYTQTATQWQVGGDLKSVDVRNFSVLEATFSNPTSDREYHAYNETAIAKDVTLPAGTWNNLSGTITNATGSITLQPYTSEILIKQ